jgi:hypothetical protein
MHVFKDYGVVRVVTEGSPFEVASDVKVQTLNNDVWETIRGFNSLSDDYALTNAQEYARQILKEKA